ncbi:MAG: hypothetical protein IJH09_06215 [Clostridia bacterium]|nr:hypothetical protein [Clostridia bacterium]
MGGYLLLAAYLACGVALMDGLRPAGARLTRLWLGLCAGLILMMWLPALFAFFVGFTRVANLLGLGVAALISAVASFLTRHARRRRRFADMPLWLPLALVIPMALVSGWLQYSHVLRNVDGALHVGQSTYGDLCLHLGIATSLRNAAFPPHYSLLPGALLGYPFLGDSMVTSMLLFGSGLAPAFAVTGTLMMALVYLGFVILCWELTRSRAATVIAFSLMFLNGGLGFIYALDGVGRDAAAFREIFTGFYRTPTNQPALNLRWVNVICDMMVPQRTLLTGWTALIPALWLLATAARDRDVRGFILLGVWAGTLPMIHTHSFLALGLVSAGAMASGLIHAPKGRPESRLDANDRTGALRRFVLYGIIAAALALPQLLTWAVPQTVHGGSMRFVFNWVNNRGNGRLIDGYCWFWIKNVGLIWLLMVPAALSGRRGSRGARGRLSQNALFRMLGLGALCVYIVAELIQFQPNLYDNNKLFYVAYMVMMPAMGMYLTRLWDKLRGLRGRALLAAAFLTVSTLSGALSLGREIVSDYRLFSREAAEAGAWAEANTAEHAVFLTGSEHNNPVAALAGRDIVCGTPSYLFFHGIAYAAPMHDARTMYERPADSAELFERYDVSYVYISSYERADYEVDEAWFADNCRLEYAAGDVCIYALTARKLLDNDIAFSPSLL